MRTHRGGLGSARLRRIKEFVDANMEDEFTLHEMAQSVELSTAHFSRMFRKSTGESPHQFLLRQRVERAKKMLRSAMQRIPKRLLFAFIEKHASAKTNWLTN